MLFSSQASIAINGKVEGSHSPRRYSGACEIPAPHEGEHFSPDTNPSKHCQYESAQGWQIFEEGRKAFSMPSSQFIIQFVLAFHPFQHHYSSHRFSSSSIQEEPFFILCVETRGKNKNFQNSMKYPGEPAPYMLNFIKLLSMNENFLKSSLISAVTTTSHSEASPPDFPPSGM